MHIHMCTHNKLFLFDYLLWVFTTQLFMHNISFYRFNRTARKKSLFTFYRWGKRGLQNLSRCTKPDFNFWKLTWQMCKMNWRLGERSAAEAMVPQRPEPVAHRCSVLPPGPRHQCCPRCRGQGASSSLCCWGSGAIFFSNGGGRTFCSPLNTWITT